MDINILKWLKDKGKGNNAEPEEIVQSRADNSISPVIISANPSFNVSSGSHTIICKDFGKIYLPSAAVANQRISILKASEEYHGILAILPAEGEKIDTKDIYCLYKQYSYVLLLSDGKKWDILQVSIEFWGTGLPAVPPTRPRVLINKNDIPRLKLKAKLFPAEFNRLITESNYYKENDANYSKKFRSALANAIIYLAAGNSANAQLAVAICEDILVNEDFKDIANKYDKSRAIGMCLSSICCVYDWCRPFISKPSIWVSNVKKMMEWLLYPYPATKSAITGHDSEIDVMRTHLMVGIAFHEDMPEIYNHTAHLILNHFVPPRKFLYEAEAHFQGSGYGLTRHEHELFCTWLFDKIGVPFVFGRKQEGVALWAMYRLRPDGQRLRDGDMLFQNINSSAGDGVYDTVHLTTMMLARYFKNPYINYEADLMASIYADKFGIRYLENGLNFLTIDLDTAKADAKQKAEMPLIKYFGSPRGEIIARTGWEYKPSAVASCNDVVVSMKIGEYITNNHEHWDSGQFQIYHKGSLAIDSGWYDDYNTSHDYNYHKRTIAHNCMLAYDPNEKFNKWGTIVSNDGGQKIVNNLSEPVNLEQLLKKGYKRASVLTHAIGNGYALLKGDLSNAYSQKVREMYRTFMFLDLDNGDFPACLIVFDKVEASDASFKKTWVLHTIQKPVIDNVNKTAVAIRDENGCSGRLVLNSFMDSQNNISIKAVGGVGYESYVDGKDYPPASVPASPRTEKGSYRIEVSPVSNSAADTFLNVMCVSDKRVTAMPEVVKVSGSSMMGVRVLNKIVMFSNNSYKLAGTVTFNSSPFAGQLEYYISDLQPGAWKVSISGAVVEPDRAVTSEEGLLRFKGNSGAVVLEYSGMNF